MFRGRPQVYCAALGAIAINHIPWFVNLAGVPTAWAAWSWSLPQPAECLAPVISGGSCREGSVILAGAECTVDWEAILGDFACIDASASDSYSCATLTFAANFQDVPNWDWAIAVVCGAVVAFAVLALISQFCLPVESSLHKALCNAPKPFKAWSLAGLIACAAFGSLLAIVAFILQRGQAGKAPWGTRSQALADALGLVAGLCMPLPVLWSFMRYGVHHLFGMSLENGWRVHIVFGTLFLLAAPFMECWS